MAAKIRFMREKRQKNMKTHKDSLSRTSDNGIATCHQTDNYSINSVNFVENLTYARPQSQELAKTCHVQELFSFFFLTFSF